GGARREGPRSVPDQRLPSGTLRRARHRARPDGAMSARFDDRFVRAALALPGEDAREFTMIVSDTRAVGSGALFVALRGDRFDGHDFLVQAREAGATAAVVRVGTPRVPDLLLYEVNDTLAAWGDLARA